MHQENTGSSQQTQVCCLFILNSNSSSKDPELEDNSHPSNFLYCYFKGDTFQESLFLPLYLPPAHLQVFKILFLKGRFQSLEGKAWGGRFLKPWVWFSLTPQARIPPKADLTTREAIDAVAKTRKRPHDRDYEPNSAVFPLKFTLSWSSGKSKLFKVLDFHSN